MTTPQLLKPSPLVDSVTPREVWWGWIYIAVFVVGMVAVIGWAVWHESRYDTYWECPPGFSFIDQKPSCISTDGRLRVKPDSYEVRVP